MKELKKVALMIGVWMLFLLFSTNVKAASAGISASKTNVNVGEKVTINISVNNAAAWNIKVSGAVSKIYASVSEDANNESFTKQIQFTPTQEGNYTINLSGDVSDEKDNVNNKKPTTISGSVTIKATNASSGNSGSGNSGVTTPSAKSSNANLANLGIRPNDFKGFTGGKTSYTTTVPNNVSSIELYADKGHSGQTISGTGTKKLQEGANTFNVIVTAENKTTKKTYTVTVNREKAKDGDKQDEDEKDTNKTEDDKTEDDNTEDTNEENKETGFGLKTLTIAGLNLEPEFSTDMYEYKVKLIGNKKELDLEVFATDENAKIEITGNEDLKEGENIITILVTDESGENVVTYQVTVNKSLVDEEAIAKQKEIEEKEKQKEMFMIAGIVIIAIAIIIIAIVFIIRRRRRYDEEDYEDYSEIPYANLNQNDKEDKQNILDKFDKYEENNEPEETEAETKERLRNEFLNQNQKDFELDEEDTTRRRSGKGKRFK